MKVTVTIEREGHVFVASAEGPSLDDATRRAAELAKLEARRSPGCTCDMAQPSEYRCSYGMMRCHGSVAAYRDRMRAEHGDKWWETLR